MGIKDTRIVEIKANVEIIIDRDCIKVILLPNIALYINIAG